MSVGPVANASLIPFLPTGGDGNVCFVAVGNETRTMLTLDKVALARLAHTNAINGLWNHPALPKIVDMHRGDVFDARQRMQATASASESTMAPGSLFRCPHAGGLNSIHDPSVNATATAAAAAGANAAPAVAVAAAVDQAYTCHATSCRLGGCGWLEMPQTYGSLQARLQDEGPPPPSILRHLLTQMADLLSHCHEHGVVLGDVGLDHWHFKDAERLTLVFVNVGSLQHQLHTYLASTVSKDSSPSTLGVQSYGAHIAALRCKSPEQLLRPTTPPTPASDVWAFGVAAYLLAFAIHPFGDVE